MPARKKTSPSKPPTPSLVWVKSVKDPQVLQIKITLLAVDPPVWRRLQIRNDATLADLRLALQIAVGWEDSHLDQFDLGEHRFSVPRGMEGLGFEDDDDAKDARVAVLHFTLPPPGTPFGYTYDFGDGWEHALVVEAVLPLNARAKYPRCVDGARACPPEDCGGPWGYADLLKVLADPQHAEYEEMTEWLGGKFDPEKFSPPAVNRELNRYFAPPRRKR